MGWGTGGTGVEPTPLRPPRLHLGEAAPGCNRTQKRNRREREMTALGEKASPAAGNDHRLGAFDVIPLVRMADQGNHLPLGVIPSVPVGLGVELETTENENRTRPDDEDVAGQGGSGVH